MGAKSVNALILLNVALFAAIVMFLLMSLKKQGTANRSDNSKVDFFVSDVIPQQICTQVDSARKGCENIVLISIKDTSANSADDYWETLLKCASKQKLSLCLVLVQSHRRAFGKCIKTVDGKGATCIMIDNSNVNIREVVRGCNDVWSLVIDPKSLRVKKVFQSEVNPCVLSEMCVTDVP